MSQNALKIPTASDKGIIVYAQPYENHNAGEIAFGPDGFLYISVGDGGSGRDPENNGQRLEVLLGKMLRLDVDQPGPDGRPYSIPSDNPFVSTPGARPEIWCYGLRNVWRFSFDRQTGQLWAGDVGQNKWEEVDILTKGGNFGWSAREGLHDFKPERATSALIEPVKDYGRDKGVSITGGYVYRGNKFPSLAGIYFYADFASTRIWGLRKAPSLDVEFLQAGFPISTFGQDRDGELYVVGHNGKIARLNAE